MRKICITWASRGIWLQESLLLQNTNELYICSKNIDSFKGKWLHDRNHLFWYDLSSISQINQFVSEIYKKTDILDVLVNNVWVFTLRNIQDMTDDDVNSMIDVNLKANILITKKLLPLLLKSKNPQIIFMSSMAAKSSINGESVYSATKAGITNFAQILRNELWDKLRVSIIHSWGVNTFWLDDSVSILKPIDIAQVLNFILNVPPPILIESIDLSHQQQWRWWQAPWSPN